MIKPQNIFHSLFIVLLLTSCSTTSDSSTESSSTSEGNPLAEMTFADNSSDAYKRACYWLNEGDNTFGFERIKEGNTLAKSEGKMPVLGVEQAMETVYREGEPQAVAEYEVVKEFCRAIGMPVN